VRFALARRPVQYDVGRGHHFNLVRVWINRVFARIKRIHPHSLLSLLHQVAVLERVPGLILSLRAHIRNDHPHIGDRHVGHRLNLYRGKARINEIPPGENHLLLQSLVPARGDKPFSVLVHVVSGDRLACDLPGIQRRAIFGGYNPHLVVGNLQHLGRSHREQAGVDAVSARRNNGNLRPAFAPVGQKHPRVLERVALHRPGQHAPA